MPCWAGACQRAIKAYAEPPPRPTDGTAAAEERGLLLASGLIVGESLMGLLLAALIGFSGQDAPLALVGEGFAPAMWLGLAYLWALGRVRFFIAGCCANEDRKIRREQANTAATSASPMSGCKSSGHWTRCWSGWTCCVPLTLHIATSARWTM